MKIYKTLRRALKYFRTYGIKKFICRSLEFILSHYEGIYFSFGMDTQKIPTTIPNTANHPPVILLAGIEWNFRFQRPQQLARQFAQCGSTVFYCPPCTFRARKNGWKIQRVVDTEHIYTVHFFTPVRSELWDISQNSSTLHAIQEEIQILIYQITAKQKRRPMLIVEQPFWGPVLSNITGADIIYDCLDDFSDFEGIDDSVHELEKILLKNADCIVSTAQQIADRWKNYLKPQCIIRNATDFEHFSRKPDSCYKSTINHPIIGYHGAIEHWFDVELVENIAAAMTDCLIVLVGGIGNPDVKKCFIRHHNIILIGEVDYKKLPFYIYAFDIGILPFLIQPLTLSTNPVKIYEYLATGIPVISVPLPEMQHFDGLVSIADRDNFVPAIRRVLANPGDPAKRRAFASQQTWAHRVKIFYRLQETLVKDR